MEAGVPQGSVLGPVLWNLAFDSVLEIAMEEEKCDILCYADDTLIVVTRKDPKITYLKASILVNRVINRIRKLGLAVATDKTETILNHSKRLKDLPISILIGDIPIDFSPSIKYLEIMIDPKWTISFHFRYIADKTNRVVQSSQIWHKPVEINREYIYRY